MFWEAAKTEMAPDGYRTKLLPANSGPGVDHTLSCSFPYVGALARASIRVRMRPMGLDVLHDLVDSGHLAPEIPAEMPTFTVQSAEARWDPARPQDPPDLAHSEPEYPEAP